MAKEPSDRKSHYIWIPGTNVCIAREQSLNGLDYKEKLDALGENGRYFMPSPKPFTLFYNSLIAAEQGRIKLYTGADKQLTRPEVNELYERFVLGKHDGVWTHLDAHFIKGSGFNKLDVATDHRVLRRDRTSRIVTHRESPLEECVDSNGLVSLIFNGQGFPTTKSEYAEWQPGKNILFYPPQFYPPQEGSVTGFSAYAGRANLSCSEGPSYSNASCGVFACAEGKPRRQK